MKPFTTLIVLILYTVNTMGMVVEYLEGGKTVSYSNQSKIDPDKVFKGITDWEDTVVGYGFFRGLKNFTLPAEAPILNTNVTNMFRLTNYNEPLNHWDVSKVTSMEGMFYESFFNQPLDKWNTSYLVRANNMFGHSFFNQPIGMWNVSLLEDGGGMFINSTYNHPLGDWNTTYNILFMDS